MREHRLAACDVDPVNRLRECRPLVLHVSGVALRQITLEDILGFLRVTRLDEEAREVRAADEALAGDVLESAFVRARDAHVRKAIGHLARTMLPARTDGRETLVELAVGRIDSERDDVQRKVAPAHGQLGAVDQADTALEGSYSGFSEPGDLVVIGECEHVHPALRCPLHQLAGRKQSIGVDGVAMKVVAKHRVGSAACFERLRRRDRCTPLE